MVSVLSSVAVFCTVYALILPAITWEASSDDVFTVNGKRIDQNYSWTDESGELSLDVHLKGDVSFDSKLPIGTKLEFDVELNPEEESEHLQECALKADAQAILVLKMHLSANGKELDLSGCKADVTLRMNKEAVSAAKAVCLSVDGNSADETDIVLTVMDENGELAAATLTEDEDPVLYFTIQANESVAAAVTSNPTYTIEHYFWFPRVVTAADGASGSLPFINTSLGEPEAPATTHGRGSLVLENSLTQKTFGVLLEGNAKEKTLKTELKLTRLFEDEKTTYRLNPQIKYMNRLFNDGNDYNSNYTLTEVWVKPSAEWVHKYPQSINEEGYVVYQVPYDESEKRHLPERIRFTNNPNNEHIPVTGYTADYPYDYTILIQDDTVVRLVFQVTEQDNYDRNVNFFDYDITDGYIYASEWNAEHQNDPINTSEQTDGVTWYAHTKQQGINSSENYTGTGTMYAFGSGNTGTELDGQTFKGNYFNKYNRNNNGVTLAYQGCTFGMLNGLTYESAGLPIPSWAGDIIAPDLFSKSTEGISGKTVYADGEYSLGFYRQGGTYTLNYVKNNQTNTNAAENLMRFWFERDNWNHTVTIYSNEFWPMDGNSSHGTDGHDLLFGKESLRLTRNFCHYENQDGQGKYFPVSDIGTIDHNAYFGMSFSVDFTIEPGYCAPLDYWFYGDDDMWVFLDELDENNNSLGNAKLVADIGGVHSATGEYVNLWEYIEQNPYTDAEGKDNTSRKYRLTVFYTERGASGSTCYMRFTLPLDANTIPAPHREEALMFEKVLNEGTDAQGDITSDEEFEFLLTLTNADGTPYYDLYDYAIYNRADTPDHKAEDAVAVEEGVIGMLIPESGKYTFTLKGGQYILITNLPDNTYYTIEEVSSGNYATLYQKGRHEHDENGNQIDTLEGAVRYNYSVGNPERINAMDHNYVCFTNSHAVKAETDPGDGKHVHIDDLITYEIEWGNDRNEIADIVITDPLDSGLDFVSAGFKSLTSAGGAVTEYGDSGRWEWNGSDDTYFMYDECSITYDEATRTVVWTWKNRPVESSGIVFLTVRVNEAASEEETTPGKFGTMTSRVENQAMVQIGNDHVIETNIVENPVWDPVKTEITPGAGKPVLTDSEIVYTVTWKNYHNQSATVVVRDPLDSALEYISGSAEVYYGAYGSDEQVRIDDASISYDPQTHTVGWDLGEQAAGSEGYVIFKVRVKKESVQKRAIRNTGFVKVGNDAEVKTNRIDNPVYGYMLPSTGGSGTFIFTICGLTLMLGPLIVRFIARRKRERRSFGGTSARNK